MAKKTLRVYSLAKAEKRGIVSKKDAAGLRRLSRVMSQSKIRKGKKKH